jgi:biopolymer transport protein ExbB
MVLDFDAYRTSQPADSGSGSGGNGSSSISSGTSGATGGGQAPSGWWDPAFARRMRISITDAPSAPLVDFPLMIRLDPTRVGYGDLRADGADLRFVGADGKTLLDHEIEQWSPDGDSFVWVSVPAIDVASGEDHLWLYYGNPDATSVESPASVWTGHQGVYHLGDTTAQVRDSSEGAHHGAWSGGAAPATNGQIADGSGFNGDRCVTMGDVYAFHVDPDDALTVEAWVRTAGAGADFTTLVFNEADCLGWHMVLEPTGQVSARFGTGVDCTTHNDYYVTTPTDIVIDDGEWHHVALVINRPDEEMRLYIDGRLDGQAFIDNTDDADLGELRVGSDWNGAHPFTGDMDEVRIARTARYGSWINAQIMSMVDGMLTFGPVEVQ